ncbi:MAG: hypothetical protein AMXMBFR77_11740 [Phycisphaerales bacterium]|nr:hypothetical protein [Phycisphaerales bacterium]MDL1905584.1 hypothetical protein [Synechococcales cyanobacterium CNB]GIK18806.1 MAG: hypothetical protein BroJett004_09700 [Planctomycetota bacterium]
MDTRTPSAMGEHAPALSAADAAALDALVAAGFDPGSVTEPHRARAQRIASLLGLLNNAPIGRSGRLVDLAFAGALGLEPSLCAEDAAALDAWLESGGHAASVPEALRARAERHGALAGAVCECDPGDRDSLVDRTLALVQASIDRDSESLVFERAAGRRVRFADLVSVAAVLLIGASVVWPILSSVRDQARRIACAANLHGAANAMSGYASLNQNALPMVTASYGGGTWWNVGKGPDRSNSANLYTLAREKYISLASLACPGNPNAATVPASPEDRDWRTLDEVSYSYRVISVPQAPRWGDSTRVLVMADRSPVVQRAVRGERPNPVASTPNHGGRGQHLLFNDGGVEWHASPVLPNGDNIWFPRSLERVLHQLSGGRLTGRELPDGPDDAFVGP